MPICQKCKKEFKNHIVINGKIRNLCKRKYCLDCSPFGKHNTAKIHVGKPKKYCFSCGKELSNSVKKYCDNECQHKYQWDIAKEKIKNGTYISSHGYNPEHCRIVLKKYLIEERGHKCEVCHFTEWLGKPIPLVCDHVNGDADNNNVENLRLVCNNCDAFSPTYKGKNRGKGRASRKMYRIEYKKKHGFYY